MSVWIDFDERLFNETRAAVERTARWRRRPAPSHSPCRRVRGRAQRNSIQIL